MGADLKSRHRVYDGAGASDVTRKDFTGNQFRRPLPLIVAREHSFFLRFENLYMQKASRIASK